MTLQYMTVGEEWVDIHETQCNIKHLYCDSHICAHGGPWQSIMALYPDPEVVTEYV